MSYPAILIFGLIFFLAQGNLTRAQGQFRRRSGHAVAVVDNYLVVDGGLVQYEDPTVTWLENKTWIIDLSQSWTNDTVVPKYIYHPDDFPRFEYQTLWPHPGSKVIYAWGGRQSPSGTLSKHQYQPPITESVWRLRLSPKGSDSPGEWEQVLPSDNSSPFPANIIRTYGGASASSPTSAYYLGGIASSWSTSTANFSGFGDNIPGLLRFDFDTNMLQNITNDGGYFASHFDPTVNMTAGILMAGHMAWLPSFGTNGVFVLVGTNGAVNDSVTESEWNTVHIYDPSTESWTRQTTRGSPPVINMTDVVHYSPTRLCFGSAQDNELETFDLVVYGNTRSDGPVDTISVLSLPSFTWVQTKARFSPRRTAAACGTGAGGQIFVVGGLDPDVGNKTDPQNWFFQPQDPWPQGIAVLNMNSLDFANTYDASLSTYTAAPIIQSLYADDGNRYPDWDSPEVGDIFGTFRSSAANDSDPSNTSSSSRRNIAIPVSVSVVVAVVLTSAALIYWAWKKGKLSCTKRSKLKEVELLPYNAENHDNQNASCNVNSEQPPPYGMIVDKKVPRSVTDYKVAWIAPVSDLELPSARLMLDEEHPTPYDYSNIDTNLYYYGSIIRSNNGTASKYLDVVIATLPAGSIGSSSVARVSESMLKTFPNIKFPLLVGIGGGIPRSLSSEDSVRNIHLGDVVVGLNREGPGVINYQRGRQHPDRFEIMGTMDKPREDLVKALGRLNSDYTSGALLFTPHIEKLQRELELGFDHPGYEHDLLFKPDYDHTGDKSSNCDYCDREHLVTRPTRLRKHQEMFIYHTGLIASGSVVVRSGRERERIKGLDEDDILCVEMEAAGVDHGRFLVIRGISDYADSHKSDKWREFAASKAAVFAKELLCILCDHFGDS